MNQEHFENLTDAQREFIISIRNLDPTLKCQILKKKFVEIVPPVVLFGEDIHYPSRINLEPWNVLNCHECYLSQQTLKKIIINLVHEHYDEADERDITIETTKFIVAAGKCTPQMTERSPSLIINPSSINF